MTAEQFAAWQARMGLSDAEASRRLGVHRATILRWRRGERKVSGSAARLCGLIEREGA